MPQIDPTQYLVNALSTLTGGLIADMSTLILGLVVMAFLGMGIDYLFFLLGSAISATRADKYMRDAQIALEARRTASPFSAEYEYNNKLYHRLLGKSVDLRMKGWRHNDD